MWQSDHQPDHIGIPTGRGPLCDGLVTAAAVILVSILVVIWAATTLADRVIDAITGHVDDEDPDL